MFTNTVRDYIPPFKCAVPLSPMDTFRDEQIHRIAIQTQRDDGNPFINFNSLRTLRDCTSSFNPIGQIPLQIRQRFADFIFLARGMEGCLWEVTDMNTRERHVVKIYHEEIFPNSRILEQRLNLEHNHLVRLLEWGEVRGHTYEIMEVLSGGSLQEMLSNGPMHEGILRKILSDVNQALIALHGVSIIHGDVKPENILWSGSSWKLGDFGISVFQGEDALSKRVGRTPMYSAPEVESGNLSIASDYWSLGVTLWHALSGLKNIDLWREWSGYSPLKFEWKELFAGLLDENISLRWGNQEIEAWLNTQDDVINRSFDQAQFHNIEGLVNEMAHRWYDMTAMIRNGEFESWIQPALERFGVPAQILSDAFSDDPDIYLFRVIYKLNPHMTPVWKEWVISEPNLRSIASGAIEGVDEYQNLLEEIYHKEVLGYLSEVSEHRDFAPIHQSWKSSGDGYYDAVRWSQARQTELVFEHPRNLALLFLYHNKRLDLEIIWNQYYTLCRLWIRYLLDRAHSNNGYLIVTYLVTTFYAPSYLGQFEMRYGGALSGLNSTRIGRRIGFNAPIASMRALPIPIVIEMCDETVLLGHRIRVAWNVSGALFSYITDIGLVRGQGSAEITVGEITNLNLYAFSLFGFERVRIRIEADFPVFGDVNPFEDISQKLNGLSEENMTPEIGWARLDEDFIKVEDFIVKADELDDEMKFSDEKEKVLVDEMKFPDDKEKEFVDEMQFTGHDQKPSKKWFRNWLSDLQFYRHKDLERKNRALKNQKSKKNQNKHQKGVESHENE